MSTPSQPNPEPGFFLIASDNQGYTYYREPKIANMDDVDDYTTKANQFVVANSAGTGWTYSSATGDPPTTFASLGDVSWNSGNWGTNKFVVVNNAGNGLDYVSQATLFGDVNNFYSLNDTFDYRSSQFAYRLLTVNANANAIGPSNFGVTPMALTGLDSTATFCFLTEQFLGGSNVNYYVFRPKAYFEFDIETNQGSPFFHNNSGYDTSAVMFTRNSFTTTNPEFHAIASNSFYIDGPNNIQTNQNTFTSSPVFSFDPTTSIITMDDFIIPTNFGSLPILNNHFFKINLSAYLQYHLNPSDANTANSFDIGVLILDSSNNIVTTLYDTCLLMSAKPGPSAKFAKQWVVQLQTGYQIQPVYRNIYLNQPNRFNECDIIALKVTISEL